MPRALVAISEGSEELEAVSVIDILRRGKIDVTVASIDKDVTVKCARGTYIVKPFFLIVYNRVLILLLRMSRMKSLTRLFYLVVCLVLYVA